MPKKLHDKLKKQAEEMGLSAERKRAYIYGTMRDMGWKPKKERKKKNGGRKKGS